MYVLYRSRNFEPQVLVVTKNFFEQPWVPGLQIFEAEQGLVTGICLKYLCLPSPQFLMCTYLQIIRLVKTSTCTW